MAIAVLGLALALALLATVTLWTVDDITAQEYRERLDLATAIASHVDRAVVADLGKLEKVAQHLALPLTSAEAQSLTDLALQLDGAARLQLRDNAGGIIWHDQGQPSAQAALGADSDLVRGVLAANKKQASPCADRLDRGSGVLICLGAPVRKADGAINGALTAIVQSRSAAVGLLPFADIGDDMEVSMVDAGDSLAGPEAAHRALLADMIASGTRGLRVHPATASTESHVTAFAPSTIGPKLGVVVEQPRDTVLAAARQLEMRLGAVAFVLLLLAAVALE